MSDAGKAVFLSYASQDAEAAKRICEALRTAGVEVWFDQSELVGGDAWDQKIRRQIKDCALLIPIISTNTQARTEGYFRLEWRLADQRTHLMAKGRPFLLPVVIDDTRDAEAHVPDSFLEVQWTKALTGEVPAAFCARVKKLLEGEPASTPAQRAVEALLADARGRGQAASLQKSSRVWIAPAIVGAAALVTLALWQPWKGNTPVTPSAAAVKPASAAAPSEARQLVAKIWEQLNKPELSRVELEVADDFYRRAAALDATDADVAAAGSQVDSWWVFHRFDDTPERREGSRLKAARALQLAPQGFEARLAQACYLIRGRGERQLAKEPAAEAETLLRALLQENPEEPRSLHALATLQQRTGDGPAAHASFERLARNPAFAAQAWNEIGWAALAAADFPLAETAANRSIAVRPFWSNLSLRAWVAISWRGDGEAAKAAIERIPASMMQEDFVIGTVVWVHWYRHDGPAILRVMRGVQHDWLNSEILPDAPMAVYAAFGHELAGQADAARVQWNAALQAVETRLTATPNNPRLMQRKGWLLCQVGRFAEADQVVRLASELDPADRPVGYSLAITELLRGNLDQAVAALEVGADLHQRPVMPALLRLDPRCDPLRNLPRFQALLARLDADPRFAVNDPAKPGIVWGEKAAPADKSVAVLAFANLSDDKGNEYFSDGISEELLNVLQKIPGLHVAARTSAFSFKGKNATAQEIGTTLHVAHLVEGSVQKIGNRVKISARLSRVATGEQLWSENFTRDLVDVFAVQSEIAQTIVTQLRGRLGGEPDESVKSEILAQVQAAEKGGTRNVAAHELYLQGRYFANVFNQEGFARAIGCFRRAVEIDPGYALAWAALSRTIAVHWNWSAGEESPEVVFREARAAAERSLSLTPDLAEGYLAEVEIQCVYDYDWRGAEKTAARALQLAPSDATSVSNAGRVALATGQVDQALVLARRAAALDPLNHEIGINLSSALIATGRLDEARAVNQRLMVLHPGASAIHGALAMDLMREGRLDEAAALAAQEPESWMRRPAIAMIAWARKNRPQADAALQELVAQHAGNAAFQIAEVQAWRGDTDQAFAWLERAARQRDAGIGWVKTDLFFEAMRADVRWPKFLATVGLADEQLK